jgi:hypothetical protein
MIVLFHNLKLRWKVLLTPVFLIVMLVSLGAYSLYTLRANQAVVDGLIGGPVRQAEVLAEFNVAIWTAHARLYNITATAANETDSNKVKAMTERAAKA